MLGSAACSDSELTPDEARRQRVQDRLEASFTDEQAECMLDRFSDEVLISLDGEGKMPQDEPELSEFTTIARECITGIVDGSSTVPEGGDPAGDQPGEATEEGDRGTVTDGADEPVETSGSRDAEGAEPSGAGSTSDQAGDGNATSGSDGPSTGADDG